ncbi:MAG: FAD-binding oxidoreductase [Hyphomicrobiales bacterium]|nr:FAD-binding oxidoreductase [Hyphomicrobiales bacterium]
MTDPILERIAAIVGAANVLVDPIDRAGYEADPRDLYHGRARAVVRPAATREVSQVLALCDAARIAVTPQGGNTGLVGGQSPAGDRREIVLSLRRLDRVRAIDPEGMTMTVEAGVTLAAAQSAAEAADRLFPLALASEGSCTIGGNLATNAGGVNVIAYGNARELTLGVEAVLADGRVTNLLSGLRKDNTGYDLRNLLIGSEGTLGIVTAATLKLFPRPRARATAFAAVSSPAAALGLLDLARATLPATVSSFELLPRIAVEFVTSAFPSERDPLGAPAPWYALVEAVSQAEAPLDDAMATLLADAAGRGLVLDATVAASEARRAALWRLREFLPEAQKPQGGSIKHDVSVPVSKTPELIERASAAALRVVPDARVCAFGHLGDGNVHFNVSQPVGADKAAFLARWDEMNEAVHAVVLGLGGSISAEHGIGRLKRDLLASTKDPTALAMMRAIKRTLDPNDTLNPGRVL